MAKRSSYQAKTSKPTGSRPGTYTSVQVSQQTEQSTATGQKLEIPTQAVDVQGTQSVPPGPSPYSGKTSYVAPGSGTYGTL